MFRVWLRSHPAGAVYSVCLFNSYGYKLDFVLIDLHLFCLMLPFMV